MTVPIPTPSADLREAVERLREAINAYRATKYECDCAESEMRDNPSMDARENFSARCDDVRAASSKVDTILADLSRLASLPQSGMGWRPIETAPKDGTTILLTDARIQDWTLTAAWIQGKISKSYCWETYDGLGYHAETFTHWMPLPPPPGSEPIAPKSCEAELLSALKGLVRYVEAVRMSAGMGESQLKRLEAAKAAIRKAEGTQSIQQGKL